MQLPFKKVLSTSVVFALFASLVLFSSCGDDDDVAPDTTAPEVTIEGLANDASVNGTVAVSLDADENDLDKVEIYVDGTLVTTLTGSPFQYTWDSNTVQDGTHTIKVVAYDKAGNKTEQQVSVAVSNTLVSFSIAANQLETDEGYKERGFVFLSDENGKVIASIEYENGKSYTLKNPEFKGEKFFLSEVVVRTGTESNRNRVFTFAQVERGKSWKLMYEGEEKDESFVGEATLNFTNLASGYGYYVESNGDQAFPDAYHLSEVVRLRKNPSVLYVERQDEWATQTPTYRLFPNITTGATHTINLSTVNIPVTMTTVELPQDAYYAEVEIKAFTEAGVYENDFRLGAFSSSGSQLTYHYPGTAFPSYYTQIELEADQFYYSRGSSEKMFEVKYLENEVMFDYSNNKLNYSAVGDFDLVAIILGYEEDSWTLVLPEGTNQVAPVLELPASLSGFQFPEWGLPAEYSLVDFGEINSYDDLKNFIRNSEYSVDDLFEDGKNYIEMNYEGPSSGGRKGKKENHFSALNLRGK